MKLSQLKAILQVAECGSLVKAADRLNTVQPAVSRQIRMLEDELQASLFERHGRGMIPTDAGRMAIAGARRIMAELERIQSDVSEMNSNIRGRVVLGMPPALADLLAVPLVELFQRTHPLVELHLISAFTGHLREWMLHGEIDIAIIYELPGSRAIYAMPLLREGLYLVGPPHAALSPDIPIAFSKLDGRDFILPPPSHSLPAMIEQTCAQMGITIKVRVKVDSLPAIKTLVASGFGWTVLPLAPISAEVQTGQLCAAPLCQPSLSRRLVIAQPADRRPSRAAQFAVAAVVSTVLELIQKKTLFGQVEAADPLSELEL